MILWDFLPLLVLTKPLGVGGGWGSVVMAMCWEGATTWFSLALGACLEGGGQQFQTGGQDTGGLIEAHYSRNSYSGCGQRWSGLQKAPLEPNQPCFPFGLTIQAASPFGVCLLELPPSRATSKAACWLLPLGDMGPLKAFPYHVVAGESAAGLLPFPPFCWLQLAS